MAGRYDEMLQVACLAGKIMLENGGEVYRAELLVSHVCAAFGAPACECFATPTAIIVTVMEEGAPRTLMRRITRRQTDLAKVEAVNGFSRRLTGGTLPPEDAAAELHRIEGTRGYRMPTALLAAGVGAASFTLLFSGGWLDFLLAFVAGLLLRALVWALARFHFYDVFINLIGGAAAALLGWLPGFLGLGTSSEVITISAIMLLVPGLLFTSGLRDLAAGDLVSGVSRVVEALCIAAALAGGAAVVYAGLQMAGMSAGTSAGAAEYARFAVLLKVIFAALGTMAFGVLFQVRGRNLPFAGLCGGAGYLVYLLVPGEGRFGAVFLASLTIAALAEVFARLFKAPATLFLVAGLIPLVPGGQLFQCILQLMERHWDEAMERGINTLLISAALAAGIIVVSSLVKLIPARRRAV